MKILVISLAGIGDTLFATPLIHELRANFPAATIDVLTKEAGARDLLESNPHLNRVFYKKTECAGCGLRTCVEFNKKCIAMVSVDEVSAAVQSMVSTNNVHWLRQNVVNLSRVR